MDDRVRFAHQSLSQEGAAFSQKLAALVNKHPEMQKARLFVCSHRRALDMASLLDSSGKRTYVRAFLNPMDWGTYEGVRRADFKAHVSPEFYESFTVDPMNTRFPGGESYADFVRRIMPVLLEVEQQLEPVVVIAPLTTLQVLHCYFERRPVRQCSEVRIDHHSVVEWYPDGVQFARQYYSEAQVC